MDDLAIGRALRAVRQRLGWRQRDVAARAGISGSAYSELERGRLGVVTIDRLREVARVLEVRINLAASWRGGDLGRLLSARHSAMAQSVTRQLVQLGWEVRPEVSFNWYGERGVIDLVAWFPATRTILLIELKTEVVDIGVLLATHDRRLRLAAEIARTLGWAPDVVASWIVLAEGSTNRRVVLRHREVIRAALPVDGRTLPGWLRRPNRPVHALSFLSDSAGIGRRSGSAPIHRVHPRSRSTSTPPQARRSRG